MTIDFNLVDLGLTLIVIVSVAQGWQRGFIGMLFRVLGWLGGVLLGLRWYAPVADWLASGWELSPVWGRPLAFLSIALLVNLLIVLIGQRLEQRLPEQARLGQRNRWFGTLPGLLDGLIVATLVAVLLLALPLPLGIRAEARASRVAHQLATASRQVEAALTPVFGEAIAQTLNMLTIEPQTDERVDLPYTLTDAPPRPEVEAQMLELINQEREALGLAPLAADPALTLVARAHAADMFARGYFAHVNLDGAGPFDRIAAARIRYRAAGENLALAPTLNLAHQGLMNSPSHRANILQPQFGRVGIGILDGGAYGLMVVQNFRD